MKPGCSHCGQSLISERGNYRYSESGLHNVVLQGVEIAVCTACGNREVSIPHLSKVHRAIALGIVNSPRRLTGPQFRYLRKYLQQSREQLARYLNTNEAGISIWENGEDTIDPANDRLMRLLVVSLDRDLNCSAPSVAGHLMEIRDESGKDQELHVDVAALTVAYLFRRAAA